MIDSHCHINDELYLNNVDEYINEAKSNGVSHFLIVGSNYEDSIKAVEISQKFPHCYSAVGIHPSDVKKYDLAIFKKIECLAKERNVIAIGEIGLDYYWDKDEEIKKQQKIAFIEQIKIANKLGLPISVHCRDAYEDCLNILKEHKVEKSGVLHCYSGSLEMAKEFIKLGFSFGFGGTVTFKNATKPKEVVKNIPLSKILLETDAPYLTPVPYRGTQNHSKYLKYICQEIAKLRNVSYEEIDEETTKNFNNLFLNEKEN